MSETLEQAPAEVVIPAGVDDVATAEAAGDTARPKRIPDWHGKDGNQPFRPGAEMRGAIAEIAARKAAGWPPSYKDVAERHGVNKGSLETLTARYYKGLIDISDAPTLATSAHKKDIDLRAELQRSLLLLGRYERHLNSAMEGLIKKAEEELKEGNFLAFDQLGIPKVVAQLGTTASLRAKKEQGVLDILEKLEELQQRRDRSAAEPVPVTGRTIPAPAFGNQGIAAALAIGTHQETIRQALKPIQ